MPDRSIRRLLAAGLLAVVSYAAICAPGAALGDGRRTRPEAVGVRLLEIPANRLDDPRSYAFLVDHVNPGTTFTRRFEVYSTASTPQHVRLYAAAAGVGKGGFTFAPGRAANELTSWIKLDRETADLPPRGRVPVTATVAVPAAAARGERYAVIWAEIASPGPGPAGNVALVNRVGIRAYIDVGPGGEPPTDFRVGAVAAGRAEDGRPRLTAVVDNTGERAVDLDGQVSLSEGPSSLSAGPFPVARGTTLAPGGHGQVTVVLGDDLPAGPWRYRLTLRSGRVSRTATGTVTFPDWPGERTATSDGPSAPFVAACGAVTAAAAVLLFVSLRRFRGRRPADGRAA